LTFFFCFFARRDARSLSNLFRCNFAGLANFKPQKHFSFAGKKKTRNRYKPYISALSRLWSSMIFLTWPGHSFFAISLGYRKTATSPTWVLGNKEGQIERQKAPHFFE
jgi:hypothetical protein